MRHFATFCDTPGRNASSPAHTLTASATSIIGPRGANCNVSCADLWARRKVLLRERAIVGELLLPHRRELANLIGMVLREILRLRPVVREVVELPRAVFAGGDDFPVAGAQGAIIVVQPPERIVPNGTLVREEWHQAL